MKKYNYLLEKVAERLNIYRGSTETESDYKARLIYSMLGRMAYTSLWDTEEECNFISIIHFTKRIETLFYSYTEMYPEIKYLFSSENEKLSLSKYIKEIYQNTGQFYHSPSRISPAAYNKAEFSQTVFSRGTPLSESVFLSGIGMYQITENFSDDVTQVNTMFQLSDSPVEYWNQIIQNVQWHEMQTKQSLEYLCTQPPFRRGYWLQTPDKEIISIARTTDMQNKLYYLYKIQDNQILVSQLPLWLVSDKQYRLLSNGCLMQMKKLPEFSFHEDGGIVRIFVGYLLPPAEQYFLELYSWPENFLNLPNHFRRICSKEIFMTIKFIFEKNGYQWKEV